MRKNLQEAIDQVLYENRKVRLIQVLFAENYKPYEAKILTLLQQHVNKYDASFSLARNGLRIVYKLRVSNIQYLGAPK